MWGPCSRIGRPRSARTLDWHSLNLSAKDFLRTETYVADSPRDYYGMLGVQKDATPEELKRAYRKLARELHPDVNPDPAAQDRFKAITAAYEVLNDPEKRRIVDLGGDPLAQGGGGGGQGAGFGGGFGGFG